MTLPADPERSRRRRQEFIDRGRASSAESLRKSSQRGLRKIQAERQLKPPVPFNIFSANCELRRHDPEHRACSGVVQRAHLIKEQWLRDELGLDVPERWHEDWWFRGCERHHHLLDHGFIKLDRRDLPAGIERRAARDPRVAAKLDREYGELPKIGAAA